MSKALICVWVLVWGLTACAHHGAVRVACEGVLRPINPTMQSAPVTVTAPDAEREP